MPSQPSILLVTWARGRSQPEGFPTSFEAALAAQLFTRLQFDPEDDTIITFYGAQRQAVLSKLRCKSACRIVDGSQGCVVEGFPDGSLFLFYFGV